MSDAATPTDTPALTAKERRKRQGDALYSVMSDMLFESSQRRQTLFAAVLDAVHVHGRGHVVVEDIQRAPLTYGALLTRTCVLARLLEKSLADAGNTIGVLLPNSAGAVVTFLALSGTGRVPALLNFSAGPASVVSACRTADVRVVLTSRVFVAKGKLEELIAALEAQVRVVFLEDLRQQATLWVKLAGALAARSPLRWHQRHVRAPNPDSPAVVLFTSGSEGAPKGVVLSHANILANLQQVAARVDFNAQDVMFNALPMFHSFGLTVGTVLPLVCGMRAFHYPSPLHYRIIPQLIYDTNATIFCGTDTFLANYARFAHPYDFYAIRYVVAGAEKLKDSTRRVWQERFGIRIYEGYGVTETSPVLAVNTPMHYQAGTVGRFLPGIQAALVPVPGVDAPAGTQAGQLWVSGPNIKLGYLRPERPGVLEATPQEDMDGHGPRPWHDTGDIVSIDAEGYVRILGRAKRFAKIGGEMVSLGAVEGFVAEVSPEYQHAVAAVQDPRKGEQLVLLTTDPELTRDTLTQVGRARGLSELSIPRQVCRVEEIPLLGTGKTDYPGVQRRAEEAVAQEVNTSAP